MSTKKWLPVVGLAAVLGAGYAGAALVAKQKVREVVDRRLAHLESRLEAQGRDATITYEDVSVHGFSLRPEAVVHGLHIQLHDNGQQGEAIITTPALHFYPHNFGMTSYHLTVPQNIEISHYYSDKPREQSVVSYNSVPQLSVEEQAGNEHSYTLQVPQSIVITTLTETVRPESEEDGEGSEVLPPIDAETAVTERVEITQGVAPEINWYTNKLGHPVKQNVVLKQVAVTHQLDPYLNFDLLSFSLSQESAEEEEALALTQEEEGNVKVATLFKLENLNFASLPTVSPIYAANDVVYTGPAWLDEKSARKPGNVFTWDVKDIQVITGLASFFASGKVVAEPEKEQLPYGELTLRFDDLKKLFAYLHDTRPKASEGLKKLQAAIERISGANIANGDVASVALVRDAGGRLKVGQLTLEEAFAVGFETMVYLPGIMSAPVVVEEVGSSHEHEHEADVQTEDEPVTPLDVHEGDHSDIIEGDESAIEVPHVEPAPAAEAPASAPAVTETPVAPDVAPVVVPETTVEEAPAAEEVSPQPAEAETAPASSPAQ